MAVGEAAMQFKMWVINSSELFAHWFLVEKSVFIVMVIM